MNIFITFCRVNVVAVVVVVVLVTCLLGRLFDRVSLIKPVSNVRPFVHLSVHK